jgi:myxalamid-type nonribosomal peptide synthetase MxaA
MSTEPANAAKKIAIFRLERTTATSGPAFGSQHTFFYLQQEHPGHPSVWLTAGLLFEGPLDPRRLETSLHELVRRHTVYRTGLVEESRGDLRQHVRPFDVHHVGFQVTDMTGLAAAEEPGVLATMFEQLRAQTQDLAVGPGLRCHVAMLAPDRHMVALAIHHVACDGTGLRLLLEELGRLYAGTAKDDRPLCFIDFVHSNVRWAESSAGQAERAYWQQRLAGAPPVELPVDHSRAEIDARRDAVPFGFVGQPMARLAAKVSDAAHAAVSRMAVEAGTTANVVYLAALGFVLHELTGQTDVCIESAQSHRMGRPALEQMHGSLTSPRVMRLDVSGKPTWQALVRRAKEVVFDAYRRSWVPIIDLAPASIRRVMCNYFPASTTVATALDFGPGMTVRELVSGFPDQWTRHWDLQFLVLEKARAVMVFYSMPLFKEQTAQMILDRYVALIESAALG